MSQSHGFELLREQEIPELNSVGRLYRHARTGAQLLSIINDDENKAFGASFRTPVSDSTGVAHILEHSVLCGSRKYPLKDPFAELLKGSLRTFLNAFTYPDKTCYPVASQNLQDFYNLVDVYLDTVFHPLLTPETFSEQGWHYEIDAPDALLIYKGVVFNEMKGAYSTPDSRLYEWSQRGLFPDNGYGFSSGGDPRNIPDLRYEDLRLFHRRHYHPSNARLFFWGNDDPEERLRILDGYLRDFDPIDPSVTEVALQPRWSEPRTVTERYPAGAEENPKALVTVNWLLGDEESAEVQLARQILDHILLGTPASPLRKALIDSGLGEDVAGDGLMDYLRQDAYSAGLKGIRAEDAEKVEEVIFSTLRRLADEGIDREMVEASLNTIEFRLRENNTGSFPRGLSVMLRALDTWLHDGDPFSPLLFEEPLSRIKERAAQGGYFEAMIRAELLENAHRTRVLIVPDRELAERETQEENGRLAAFRADASEDEVAGLVAATRRLKELQAAPDPDEARRSLPTLRREDLDREHRRFPLEVEEDEGATVVWHDLFTGGIVYLDLGLDLTRLPADLLPYASLFGKALLQIGTEREDYVRLTQRIGRQTGGIRRQILHSAVRERERPASWLFLRGKAMTAQTEELLAILRDVLTIVNLDNPERFLQMALEEKARLEASIAPAGNQYADLRLRSYLDRASWASEQTDGIAYLFFLRDLIGRVEKDWPSVLAALESLRSILTSRSAVLVNATLADTDRQPVHAAIREFLDCLPNGATEAGEWPLPPAPVNEGLTIPGQVNYVAFGANIAERGYRLHGSIAAIRNYLRSGWLWEKVRKEGGAYGINCRLDALSGAFTFTSYRDPNLLGTLDIFGATGKHLREASIDERELTRSIIGAIADLDPYLLPDAKGFTSLARWLTNQPDDWMQARRDELLATTAQEFRAFGDVLDRMKEGGLVTVVGSREAIAAANETRGGSWLTVRDVL